MKKIITFTEFLNESKLQELILTQLHEGVKMVKIESLLESNLYDFAKSEIDHLIKTTPDAIISEFVPEMLSLIDKFGNSGQSGGSAGYTSSAITNALKTLMSFKPISPVTDTPEEWNKCSLNPDTYQHKRCSAVFRDGDDSKAHYLDAIVWKGEEEYDTFTGRVYVDDKDFELISSHQNVKFPFTPKTFLIDVIRVPIKQEEAESRKLHYIEGNNNECY